MGLFSGDFYSESLRMTTQIKVIFPEHSNDVDPIVAGTPRVLYLLHGLSGSSAEWTRFSKIEYYAKKYNFIIIMPEVQRSFYCDTVCGTNYFTYVADELPEICNRWFRLDSSRDNTFIAGESMGGYGAVKIGLSRPDRFGGIASLSGVLDYVSFAKRIQNGEWPDFQPGELLALHGGNGAPKIEDDPIFLVQNQAKNTKRPRLIQLCGRDDFLFEDNLRFRDAAEAAGYGHTWLEAPGDHEWPYWDKAIQYAIRFFCGMELDGFTLY